MNPPISMVANARSTECKPTRAESVIAGIRDGRWRGPVAAIRRAVAETMAGGASLHEAKANVSRLKRDLPAILWSGVFRERNNTSRIHPSGLIVADLDDLDPATLARTRAALIKDPHLYSLFTSPTGTGLKAIFRIPSDEGRHSDAFTSVAQQVRQLCDVEIDTSGRDTARLCFVSHDPDCYLNTAAAQLALPPPSAPIPDPSPPPSINLTARQRIATEVLGDIVWGNDGTGYCHCPGANLHSNENGHRDCRVYLDRVPSIHCVHNSCRSLVEVANHELRSRIGRVEAPLHGTNGQRLAKHPFPKGSIAQEYLPTQPTEQPHQTTPWPAPKRLPDPLPGVIPIPLSALPPPFQGWIQDCGDRMQCSTDFLAVAAIVAAGSVLGNRIAIAPKRHDSWHEVPIFWGVLVGRPGTMKSPALAAALVPLTCLERTASERHRQDLLDFEAEKLLAEARRKKGVGRLGDLAERDLEAAHELATSLTASDLTPPTCPRYLSNDPTVPKLGELLRDNGRGLLLLRDELTGFFRTLESEGHEGDRAFFLEGWNGKQPYTVDRIERGTIRIERHTLSVLGGIQPGPLQSIMRTAIRGGTGDDGLLQRFQIVAWPDRVDWRNVDRLPNGPAREAYNHAFEALNALDPIAVGAVPLADNGVPALRFASDAQDRFDEWRQHHEQVVRAGDEHPAFEAYLAKVPRTVATLALVHHLASGGTGPVPLSSVEAALTLQAALATHARRLYVPALQGPALAARELARRLEMGKLPDDFTSRDVHRNGWSGLDSPELARDACDYLCDLNWLCGHQDSGNGRPTTRYSIHPLIRERARGQADKTVKSLLPSLSSVPGDGPESISTVLSVPLERAGVDRAPDPEPGRWSDGTPIGEPTETTTELPIHDCPPSIDPDSWDEPHDEEAKS